MKSIDVTLIVRTPERSSALTGGPAQIVDKALRHHELGLGHSVLDPHAEPGVLTCTRHRASPELVLSAIAPAPRTAIRHAAPPWGPVGPDDSPVRAAADHRGAAAPQGA